MTGVFQFVTLFCPVGAPLGFELKTAQHSEQRMRVPKIERMADWPSLQQTNVNVMMAHAALEPKSGCKQFNAKWQKVISQDLLRWWLLAHVC